MARVDLLESYFSSKGFSVDRITSDYRHIEKAYRNCHAENETLVHVPSYKRNLSLGRVYSHACFAKGVVSTLEGTNYDLLWVLLPPNQLASSIKGWKRANSKTKLVFDVIDMWPETMPYKTANVMGHLVGWDRIRNHSLSAADLVVTECELFSSLLKEQGAIEKARVVYFARESRYVEATVKPPTDCVSLCYLGSVNHIVDIETIANIIRELATSRPVRLHVIGAGERYAELVGQAMMAGAEVVSHGAIHDWAEKQRIFDICHYGLNVMRKSVCVGLTMKSIDYLDAGLPLINTIMGDTWHLVDSEAIGFNYPDRLPTIKDDLSNREIRTRARDAFEKHFDARAFCQSVQMCVEELGL